MRSRVRQERGPTDSRSWRTRLHFSGAIKALSASAGTRDVLDEPEASAAGATRRPVADASGSSNTSLAPALVPHKLEVANLQRCPRRDDDADLRCAGRGRVDGIGGPTLPHLEDPVFLAAPGERRFRVARVVDGPGEMAAREGGVADDRAALAVAPDLENAAVDLHLAFGLPAVGRFAIEERLPLLGLHLLRLVVFVLLEPLDGFLVNRPARVAVEETEQVV